MQALGTEFVFKAGDKGVLRGDVLLIPLIAKPHPPLEFISRLDRLCDGALAELLAVKAVRDEVGHLAHTTRAGACRRIVAVSLGDLQKLNAYEVRRAGAAAARWMMAEKLTRGVLWAEGLAAADVENGVAEFALGMALAGFKFATYRQPDEQTPEKIEITIRAGDAGHVTHALPAVRSLLTVAQATNYVRRLGHEPANVLNPATFTDEARRLAHESKLKFTLLNAQRVRELGMHGLLAVGQAAAHPPCLVQLEYRGAPKARTTTVLVGKGITFDTGGYSIKPGQGMEGMKFDMTGAATVLGVLRGAAALKLKCNLIGLLALAENAISDRAYRPGDILKLAGGKTVEVISTDAEGRLILADALWYAQRKLQPTALIDVATLTGGVGIALGTAAAGLMSTDDELAADLGEAGRRTHERLWRLPLWDDYKELIKGTDSDIKNSAGKRDAHAIVGGMFLKEFVQPGVPWAHLDIAAVANLENGKGPTGKGATGFGVRLLLEFLRLRGA